MSFSLSYEQKISLSSPFSLSLSLSLSLSPSLSPPPLSLSLSNNGAADYFHIATHEGGKWAQPGSDKVLTLKTVWLTPKMEMHFFRSSNSLVQTCGFQVPQSPRKLMNMKKVSSFHQTKPSKRPGFGSSSRSFCWPEKHSQSGLGFCQTQAAGQPPNPVRRKWIVSSPVNHQVLAGHQPPDLKSGLTPNLKVCVADISNFVREGSQICCETAPVSWCLPSVSAFPHRSGQVPSVYFYLGLRYVPGRPERDQRQFPAHLLLGLGQKHPTKHSEQLSSRFEPCCVPQRDRRR